MLVLNSVVKIFSKINRSGLIGVQFGFTDNPVPMPLPELHRLGIIHLNIRKDRTYLSNFPDLVFKRLDNRFTHTLFPKWRRDHKQLKEGGLMLASIIAWDKTDNFDHFSVSRVYTAENSSLRF